MPRESDRFREYVDDLENRKWRCTFCKEKFAGSTPRIRAHLAGIPGRGIKACKEVKDAVRAEALETFNSKGSGLDKSTGGTSGKGTEGTVFGASQSVFPSEGASNPNGPQNSNQHGCTPQQQSFCWPTGTGTAPACPQDQVSLPPSDMPLDNLDNAQQSDPSNHWLDAAHGNENASSLQPLSSLYISEPLALPELSTHLEFGTGTAPACPQYEVSLPREDKSTGETSGEGTEGIDMQNSNQLGCKLQQPSFHPTTGTGTAPACPQDQGSLPARDMPLDNLDNTQQSHPSNRRLDAARGNENASSLQPLSSLYISEPPALPELSTHLEFGIDTALACLQDEVSLPPGDMPLDNLANTQQSDPSNRRLDAAHGNENASSLQPLASLYISEPLALPELSTHLEFGTGTAPACPQYEVSLPREDKSTGETSGEGTEGIDMQNSNQLGCKLQQPSFHPTTGTGTAPACPQDQGSLPPRDMPLDNLDNTQQSHLSNRRLDAARGNENASSLQPLSSLYISEPPALPELSTHLEFGIDTALACLQDEVSLPPGDMPLDNLANTQHSDPSNHRLDAAHGNENASSLQQLMMDSSASFYLDFIERAAHFELPSLPEPEREQQNARELSSIPNDWVRGNSRSSGLQEFIEDGITSDSPLHLADWSNLRHSLPENLLESHDVIVNTSEEIETNGLYNPTVGSSVQINSSLDVDSANRLQDCGQLHGVEVVPVPSNTSPTDIIQHPGQLPPRCDKEDGNDTCRFPSQVPMDVDPSIASLHTSDSRILEATDDDSLVVEASTNTVGPSSSHAVVPPSSSQASHNALPPPQILSCGTGLIGPLSLPDMYGGVAMTSHPNTRNNFEENRALKRRLELLYSKEADMRDELKFAASLSLKKPRKEVAKWLVNVEKLRVDCTKAASEECLRPYQQVDILMREAEDLSRQGKGLVEGREVTKLLEDKMVGEAFRRNTTKILDFLVGNQLYLLGIYGMGGVGKTTIMVHIYNRLLEEANYGNVLWIPVSQDFNTPKLQDDIWRVLDLGIPQENDVRKRAAMLWDCLMEVGKSTIILDDVWEHFDLKEVGIPIGVDKVKLVLTTRSLEVCRQMQCQEMIKIEPLSHTEAEGLFLEELGFKVVLNLETKAVVKSIVKECAGLPLAVITMARSMRGVTDVFEWTNYLERLRESDMGQMDMEKVLKKLQFSYNLLGDHEVQQCFLSCALYSEDKLINKFELIEFFIDQGLIGRLNTREKQHARGLTILNKLENACLLEDHEGGMKMHDLIRDMALHIMGLTSIVQAGKGLRTIPSEEYWTDALEKVSLMENYIGEFPLNMSPNCPKLSTFLLNANRSNDVVIPDSFFKQLWGLKVLNLSGCNLRELPDSISDLVHLTALLIRNCQELHCIPYLGKLRSLRKLDAFCCVKLEAIKGLEMLVNLTYLDITYTCIKRLPKGTLGAALKLQYLSVQAVNEEDIIKLCALETLKCQFEDVDDFNRLVRVVSKQGNNRHYYKLVCQKQSKIYVELSEQSPFRNCERTVCMRMRIHCIVSAGGESSGSGICILIPLHVRTLSASNCDGATNLSDMGSLENLEELIIENWENLLVLSGRQDEEIIDIHDSPTPTPAPLFFLSLRVLSIYNCLRLQYLFGHGPKFCLPHLREIDIMECEEMVGITVAVTSSSQHPPPAFPSLEVIYVRYCGNMERVVESEWLPHFPNLRTIEVVSCENMEEIIGGPPQYMPVEEISLEKLSVEHCDNLRKLFPCELLIHLQNIHSIYVDGCEGMVEMISGARQGQEGSIMTSVNNTPSSFQSSISLPKLNSLRLHNLPQLKSICEVSITCDSIRRLAVLGCPELNKIPLQLRLCDIGDLPHIEVESEEKWKMLIWDHPNAQAILQSHLLFLDGRCILKGQRKSHWSEGGSESSDSDFEEV